MMFSILMINIFTNVNGIDLKIFSGVDLDTVLC